MVTYKVSDIKKMIAESSNEFKAKLGDGVESKNKENSGKAYKDVKKRGHDFDGGLTKEIVDVDPEKGNVKMSPWGNKTTLDYQPETMTPEMKKRLQAQAEGYTSVAEKENGIEKSGDHKKGEKIYKAIKDAGKERHEMEKKLKKTGLQAREMPDEVFDREEMYESKNLKTVYFKRTEFVNESMMLNKIPDEFKNDGTTFKMKDKNGSEYIVEWKNNKGKVLEHTNKQGFNESFDRMKQLFNYNYSDTKTDVEHRINENDDRLQRSLDIMRKINNINK